ncbi:MAG: hypothetical protein LBG88_03375 [Christensenellaceae bacterium]|nr:hypothetical protein [Christensenellaceae bacterium]
MDNKKFLFYDVECATCQKGAKLYSLGFVLTDENFNVIVKEDHLINPCIKEWDWYVVKNMSDKGIKKQCEAKPNFAEQYPFFKRLLENPDHTICGFSIANDIRFFNQDAERYGLAPIDTKCFDIQSFYNQYSGNKGQKALPKVIAELEIDCTGLREHKSCDDAHGTMLIMKEICKRMNITGRELTDLCKASQINASKYWNDFKNHVIVDAFGNEVAPENMGKKALLRWEKMQKIKSTEKVE